MQKTDEDLIWPNFDLVDWVVTETSMYKWGFMIGTCLNLHSKMITEHLTM